MSDEMFRNKAMTVAFSSKPKRGEVGWKLVADQPTEHICTKSDEWMPTVQYKKKIEADKASRVAYYRDHPKELREKIERKRLDAEVRRTSKRPVPGIHAWE